MRSQRRFFAGLLLALVGVDGPNIGSAHDIIFSDVDRREKAGLVEAVLVSNPLTVDDAPHDFREHSRFQFCQWYGFEVSGRSPCDREFRIRNNGPRIEILFHRRGFADFAEFSHYAVPFLGRNDCRRSGNDFRSDVEAVRWRPSDISKVERKFSKFIGDSEYLNFRWADPGPLVGRHCVQLAGGNSGLLANGVVRTAKFTPLEKGNAGSEEQPDDREPLAKYAMAFAAACLLTISLILLRKGINKSGGAGAFIVAIAFPFFLGGIVVLSRILEF
jgi:hypothetical protein